MEILWLSHLIPYPPKGGVLQRSYNLIKELARQHEVDLLAFNQTALMRSPFPSLEEGVQEARKALNIICRRFEYIDIPSNRFSWLKYVLAAKSILFEPYNINWLKSKAFSSNMANWLKKCKYDLVHFDTISLIPFFPLVVGSNTTSLDHHNIESHMLLRRASNEINILKKGYFWQEGKRLKRYERFYCPQFTINITCSDMDTERLHNIAPNANVQTIPNGVDLDYFKSQGLPIKPNHIIFAGSMNWYPNIDAVLYLAERLWPRLKQKHTNLVCDIYGANPPTVIQKLSERFADFNVHGFVDDVRPYIEQATVYVCPIRDGGGTKLKILDAMAMGKAVVAHPIACEGINVKHDHNVMLAENEQMFIEHIDYLLKASEKRESLGMAARKLMEEEYGYRAIGKQLSNAFEACIK